jgi:cyanophycin synthetase
VGDRRDEDIENIGFLSADVFDHVIIRMDKDLRGRSAEDIARLVKNGISRSLHPVRVDVIPDELEALQFAMTTAPRGAFITVFTDQIEETCEFLKSVSERKREAVPEVFEAVHL